MTWRMSCRCTTTSFGEIRKTNVYVWVMPSSWLHMQEKFSVGNWPFLGPGSESKWNATDIVKPGGEWDRVAELMMKNLLESGHPVFCATSALNRGQLKSKGGGKSSLHFCADTVLSNSFFAKLFRSVSSVFTEQSQICVKNSLLH